MRVRIRIKFGRLDPDPHSQCGSGSKWARFTQKKRRRVLFLRAGYSLQRPVAELIDPVRELKTTLKWG